MATKLKKPITVTFTHVENAVLAAILSQGGQTWSTPFEELHPNIKPIKTRASIGELGGPLRAALKEQGVDWNTWLPESPLTIGGHEVVFNPDGSAKIGCTTVSAKEIDEFLKRRPTAEWPKYYRCSNNGFLYLQRSSHPLELVRYFSLQLQRWCDGGRFSGYENQLAAITRSEAASMVGESNLPQ